MQKRATLKNIAQKAGVSSAAVSIILNDKPSRISQEKKDEVKRIAKELNYIPNQIAKSLSTQQTYTIGLIVPDLANPFFATLSKEIEKQLTKSGYFTFIMNSDEEFSQDREIVKKMLQRQVDGLLLCASNANYQQTNKTIQWLESIPIPLVLIDRTFNSNHLTSVSFNHFQGGYLAGEYIYNQIKNTKNKIACLTGDLRTSTSSQRLQGFQKALEEHNCPYNPYILSGDYSIESGYKLGKKLIKSISTDQLAGVFCFNDLIAYGFIRAIKEKNLKWQNFNIVGYDSLQIGEVLGYSFPSVSQNIPHLAKQACKLLLEQMKQEDSLQIQLEVELKKSELS